MKLRNEGVWKKDDGIMTCTHLHGELMSVRHAKTALMRFMRNGSDETIRAEPDTGYGT